jgi:hypothetical protein
MPRSSAPRGLAAATLLLAAAAALAPGAAAHAYLAKPMSRNLLANSDFCECWGAGFAGFAAPIRFLAQFSTSARP